MELRRARWFVLAVTLLAPLGAQPAPVLNLPFDGDLRDRSGHGHDATGPTARFAAGQTGQALQVGRPVSVADSPELQAAPGLRIEGWFRLGPNTKAGQELVVKRDEYMLRQDPIREGGRLSFFVYLGGWEPRCRCELPIQTDTWYHVVAAWDGVAVTLQVNDLKARTVRSGVPKATTNPLLIGAPGAAVDELQVVNPRLPVLRVQRVTQEHAILRAGRPERLTATVQNVGSNAPNVTAALELPAGVTVEGATTQPLGALPMGATRELAWTVRTDQSATPVATLRLTAEGLTPVAHRFALPFFAADDPKATLTVPPTAPGAKTWYVDSVAGRNTNAGTSPEAAWQDFTPVNGKVLGPGERLLIKRGSVINQELSLSAAGTPERWAEIGAYGEGARPILRRNWDIDDRCALIKNPDYLRIASLTVCYAGKGLMVHYDREGHAGLVIEDCIAHHIEGLYRPNANGIPEWRGRNGAPGDGRGSSTGFGIVGARARDLVLRNCEMYQCSWGFFASGEALTVDRVYCHDNYARNTSPHPALVSVYRSYLQNSVFDAPGWHAFAGTMGIMLVNPQGLIIRNCTWRNQPDSGSHDEGGIDFENTGSGCLIDHCTFQNNAGAAIEVLGLSAPQPRNVEIADTRFIQNNVARKLGPGEIFIWGQPPSAEVCCSNGTIHGNGYVTLPGVEFFVNQAPKVTDWTLTGNTAYPSPEALRQAMPYNEPPVVDAGPDVRTDRPVVSLAGHVTDDGKAAPSLRWEELSGPGPVAFSDPHAERPQARFTVPGDYELRLVADDGELWLSDRVTVHLLPPGASVASAWEFNRPLDKEGWTEVNPGTKVMEWLNQQWPCKSEPVQHVAGGYYLLAIEDSPDAHLLSPARIGTDLGRNRMVTLRFQNHTPATSMRLRFTTDTSPAWDEAKAKAFAVTPNDDAPRTYTLDLADVPGWTGRLNQLRLDLATGAPLTGTVRVDYVWVGQAGR